MRTALTVVAVMALIGCSSDDGERADPTTTTRATQTTASQSTSTTTAEVRTVLSGECDDPTGDGHSDGDLVAARVGTQGDVLTVTWTTATAPPPAQTYAYFLNIPGASKQIGLKVPEGDVEPSRFVFDFDSGQQENLTGTYMLDGNTASVVVPMSALGGVEPSVEYSAVYSIVWVPETRSGVR